MKININAIDKDNFMVHPHQIAGDQVYLVQPVHIGAKWTTDTLKFRSSVWTEAGEPVSLSFPKFFNFGEHPEITPLPKSLEGAKLIEKIDGSTLIVSWYKGQLITRTRGTTDATKLLNGHEIATLLARYPNIPVFAQSNPNTTHLFEWVTSDPEVSIVIKHPEPDLYLTGAVDHSDYSMAFQSSLDVLAEGMGVKRPKRYTFDSIEEMLSTMAGMKDIEGICLYYKGDQSILKIKTEWYRALHQFKENCHDEPIMDLFLEYGRPEYMQFIERLEACFDFECMSMARPIASRICDTAKEVNKVIDHMKEFVEEVKKLPNRKEQAVKIIKAYGDTNRASYVFSLLDGRALDNKSYKKLLFQLLK